MKTEQMIKYYFSETARTNWNIVEKRNGARL